MKPVYRLQQVFADLNLAQRMEEAEAQANAGFVETRAQRSPEVGAEWMEAGGAYAMFDGPESPSTQTFGLGMREPVTGEQLDRIEEFFSRRGAPALHELCPLADLSAPHALAERGYEPFEFTSVMFLPFNEERPAVGSRNERMTARLIREGEEDHWADLCATGWNEFIEYAHLIREMACISLRSPRTACFVAELEGVPVATASMSIHGGIVLLAGASTIPEARRKGAQNALLEARLRYGQSQGCDLAMMGAQPGSASQRNAERQGFRIAYTRMKWRKRESQREIP